MAEIILEKSTMQKVVYNKSERPADDTAFAFYIFLYAPSYSMRQRNVLNDNEWAVWLRWMKNCFRYGTIREQWKQIQSEEWFNPDFVNLVNGGIIGGRIESSA
jgi:hypothetical protein